MSNAESNVSAWLTKAEHDLLNIENNLVAKDIPWDTVCFHAQQVVEKMLKALLVSRGRDVAKTHDLIALLTQCVKFHPSLADCETDCRRLTTYGVIARYPDHLFEPEEADGRGLIAAMKRVRAQIMPLLPKSS